MNYATRNLLKLQEPVLHKSVQCVQNLDALDTFVDPKYEAAAPKFLVFRPARVRARARSEL